MSPAAPTRSVARTAAVAILALALALGALVQLTGIASEHMLKPDSEPTPACGQVDPLVPHAALRADLDALYASSDFVGQMTEWLGGAVRIPTKTHDDMGAPDTDPRWAPFHDLHAYLEKQFPLVYSRLSLTKVNTLALVYTWAGSDASLKPILLTAHQDVVPVLSETLSQWVQPPFSGLFDGEWVWGRGSVDDKSGIISIMASLETLIGKGFTPRRTIVLGFGHDEEIAGEGARAIATFLEEKYGADSFSLLVDEGGLYQEESGVVVAYPSVAEKGYMDVRIQVDTPGGHSSVPPDHTGIGILSALVVELESHPEEPKLTRDSAVFAALQCQAAHVPNMSPSLRLDVNKAATSDKALRRVQHHILQDPTMQVLLSTTQAVDLIGGGVKVNALPEQAWAVVNHRIATHSSTAAVRQRHASLAASVARRFNVSLVAFGEEFHTDAEVRGKITLSEAFDGHALEPAPVTPTDDGAAPYKLLSGTIRAAYRASADADIVVAPGMLAGNTDTKRYWALTRHIFRYNHLTMADIYNGFHTINEAIRASALPPSVQFYSYLILNADESNTI